MISKKYLQIVNVVSAVSILLMLVTSTALAQEYKGNVELNGFDGSIYLPEATTHGISYLTLYFDDTYKGKYTIILTTYPSYQPTLEGATKYFSITPEFKIKQGSSMDIISNSPIEVYQLIDNQWMKLSRPVSIYVNTYRVQITSIGTFAVKNIQYVPNVRVNGSLTPNEIQERMNLNITEIKEKDEKIYSNTKTAVENLLLLLKNTISNLTGRKLQ